MVFYVSTSMSRLFYSFFSIPSAVRGFRRFVPSNLLLELCFLLLVHQSIRDVFL